MASTEHLSKPITISGISNHQKTHIYHILGLYSHPAIAAMTSGTIFGRVLTCGRFAMAAAASRLLQLSETLGAAAAALPELKLREARRGERDGLVNN